MTIKLTVAPNIKERLQRNQSHTGTTEQLSFNANSAFADKINRIARANKRSVSSVLAEMVEFALDSLDAGDTELDQAASTMHPLPRNAPLSYHNIAADQAQNRARKQPVTLRMTNAHKPTDAEIADQSLKRLNDITPDYDKGINELWRKEVNAANGYSLL